MNKVKALVGFKVNSLVEKTEYGTVEIESLITFEPARENINQGNLYVELHMGIAGYGIKEFIVGTNVHGDMCNVDNLEDLATDLVDVYKEEMAPELISYLEENEAGDIEQVFSLMKQKSSEEEECMCCACLDRECPFKELDL